MPEFKSLEYKNIQSVGNHPIKIDLNRSPTTLIGGLNGSGKSTMLYAFAYGLFGKFISGAKLADAINSVNKKNLLVTIKFTERGDDYTVVRGEKPKKFEIYKNDEMLDQNANARDQQKILELILGMDFKTFTQIVLLNKERYVPFMEMGAADRRKIVEDILGISIFSVMNDICKQKIKENQREVANIEKDIEVKRTELEGQQKLIRQIQETIASQSKQLEESLDNKREEESSIQEQIDEKKESYDNLSLEGHSKVKKQRKEYEKLAVEFDQQIKSARKSSKFFEDNDICPTCNQDISDELKNQKKHECDKEVEKIQSVVAEMIEELQKVIEQDEEYKSIEKEKELLQSEIRNLESLKKRISKEIQDLLRSSENTPDNDKLEAECGYYDQLEDTIRVTTDTLEEKIREGELLESMRTILKDDGVKAIIVREYMSLINKKINEYLQAMNFYINMTLDENFKESFSAMHKENFTMNNLSTGQKSRVNIAIWLALLEVASIKNSVVSNVLFLDEILENLDSEGVKDVMILFNEKLSDKNIYVITQRFGEFQDLFRSQIQFKLNGGFTEIV